MKLIVSTSPCPCRAQDSEVLTYAQCCQPWHQGLAHGNYAGTPEQLMRSRYSAYALATHNNPQGHAMLAYLHATWHHSSAPGDLELSPTQWIGLTVIAAQASGDAGVVEFEARYKVDGKAYTLHEVSRFTRAGSTSPWLYIDGQVSEG